MSLTAEDVYDRLWTQNLDIAQDMLKMSFLQHMQSGDLDADLYVTFMIQDFYYVVKVTEMLKDMSEKKMPADVHSFMVERYQSFKSYTKQMLEGFNLTGVSEIQPNHAIEKYLSDYKAIMQQEEAIFFAVALLPCERLWLWIAQHLQEKKSNAYFNWKMNNSQGHPEKHFRKLLDEQLKSPERIQKAAQVFRRQMENEKNFFGSFQLPK